VDATIKPYLPSYSGQKWLRRATLLALVISVAGLLGYGIPVIVRAVRVQTSRENHSQEVAVNRLFTLIAYGRRSDESVIGRLARKLIELKEEPNSVATFNQPVDAKAALEHYRVHWGEFSTAAHELGWTILKYEAEGTTYYSYDAGNFTPEFINEVVRASPETLPNMLWSPPEPIRDYGLYRWQWLVLGLAALWAAFLAIGMLLVRHRRIWQVQAERRFKDGLSSESYDILHLVRQIEGHPKIAGHDKLLQQTHDLLKASLKGSVLSNQEVKEELASLAVSYRKRLAAVPSPKQTVQT